MQTTNDNINVAMSFVTLLIGTKYSYWHPGDTLIKDSGPFWAYNGPVSDIHTIRNDSCCCVGVTNLMRRNFL